VEARVAAIIAGREVREPVQVANGGAPVTLTHLAAVKAR